MRIMRCVPHAIWFLRVSFSVFALPRTCAGRWLQARARPVGSPPPRARCRRRRLPRPRRLARRPPPTIRQRRVAGADGWKQRHRFHRRLRLERLSKGARGLTTLQCQGVNCSRVSNLVLGASLRNQKATSTELRGPSALPMTRGVLCAGSGVLPRANPYFTCARRSTAGVSAPLAGPFATWINGPSLAFWAVTVQARSTPIAAGGM